MLARRDMFPAVATKTEASVSTGHSEQQYPMASIRTSRSKNKNKRRFSDEQIRSLESTFETESSPELQIKQQLANELGLQSRQVAIWFQNKRARSKSKLIEQEYLMLKSSYDNLVSKLESSKKENHCLLIKLQRLGNLLGKQQANKNHRLGQTGEGIDEDDNKMDTNTEAEEKTKLASESYDHKIQMPLSNDASEYVRFLGGETNILNMAQVIPDGSLTSLGNWCSFESSSVLEHPSSSSQWWEFWP